jgi:hypothetical protein
MLDPFLRGDAFRITDSAVVFTIERQNSNDGLTVLP